MALRNYDGIVSIHLDNDVDILIFFSGGGGERAHNFPKRIKSSFIVLKLDFKF